MEKGSVIAIVAVIILAIIGIGYFGLSGKSPSSTTVSSALTSSSAYSTTINNVSTAATSTVAPTQSFPNSTLTDTQLISTLGTGWIAASEFSYGPANITAPNGTLTTVSGIGVANFSSGGSYLTARWAQFQSPVVAKSYILAAFNATFVNASSKMNGTQGNASYVFYTGQSIYNGQSASALYANDGDYGIIIFNRGTAFQVSQGKELLSYQLSDLKTS